MTGNRWIATLTGLMMIVFALAGCLGDDAADEDPPAENDQGVTPEPEPQREPNEAVYGSNFGCLDALALWEHPELDSPLAEAFDVEEGTTWEASGNGESVHVEFYQDSGAWADHGDDTGQVPAGATYGIACAMDDQGLPVPDGEWTYQDGIVD